MKNGLLLGAGFSYELGMPLSYELTETFLGVFNERSAVLLANKLADNSPYTEDRPINVDALHEGMKFYIDYKSSAGNNYEEFLSELEKLGDEPGRTQSDRDSFQYLLSIFYEIIHTILCLYQKVSYELLYEDVFGWFRKLDNLLSENETWVFTLNHDIYLECLALDCQIPISYGDTETVHFPKNNLEMSNVLTFTCNSRNNLGTKFDGFIRGEKGINLVKLHGGLSELEYSEGKIICNLPLNMDSSFDLVSSFKAVEEMAYYHGNQKVPSGKMKVITNLDGELDVLCKSMLTGGKKYSTTNNPKAGEEKLILMEEIFNELDEIIVMGYGFGDKHVNFRLSNAMVLNPNLSVRIVDPTNNRTPECLEQFDYEQRVRKAYCGAPHWIDYCESESWNSDMIEGLKRNSDKRYAIQVEVERRLHAGELDG